MTPSKEQEDIFEWVSQSSGNALIEACGGSGKTTTLVQCLKRMTGSICFMAYNKKAAVDIQEKCLSEGLSEKAQIGTVHSFGYAILRAQKIFPKPDDWKRFGLLAERFSIEREHQLFYKNLLSMAKQRGFGLPGEPSYTDINAWKEMIETFSLADDLPEDLALESAIAIAAKMLQASKFNYQEFIDFDDMIWLPLVLQLSPPTRYQWVLLDEAQDTNPARRALARALLASNGRLIAVGDPAQAIYGFTGADNDSLRLIGRDFQTTSLPLHTSFRCAKAVVTEARRYVNHISAFNGNPEGIVHVLDEDSEDWFGQATSSDVFLCRNTRPLISLAFRFIRAGRAAKVEGRKIGESLKALAKRFQYSSRSEFNERLSSYRRSEVEKLRAKRKGFQAAALDDKIESLHAVADGLGKTPFSKTALLQRIEDIFAEGPQRGAITLCTIHRSKGLEWDKVYWLYPNKLQPSPFATQDWELEQENNLCYVAITRAKRELVIINQRDS